ncbi:MAG: NADH:ubiquinone reductase (Na(+)-transporting) subunit C [Candidatus Competibacteraceae bacterium]|nr:NADH:ubiquinone reductase (Na(+)-transporting) subunit C [Candidatus Competibacteraceae bacterium]
MNKESNAYIILFSVIMVVIVGVGLAVIAQITKPNYIKNQEIEKKQNILSSVGIRVSPSEAEATYNKHITGSVVFKQDGSVVDGQDAFLVDLAKELKKPEADQFYTLFFCSKDNESFYIIPMRGKGLWDAVWGFVAVNNDGITIAGAMFDHKGETPGLGAEISKEGFQKQFLGKKIVDASGEFKGVEVAKQGKYPEGYEHSVDGISGGTITSNGVSDMIQKYLKAFQAYMKVNVSAIPAPQPEPETLDTLETTLIEADTIN